MPRIHCPLPLLPGAQVSLPPGAARHVQVLRMQPGQTLTLFTGEASAEGEFSATITRMGRSDVDVEVGAFHPVQREMGLRIHLAVGMPANERMDWLVEKATELGVASIQPLMTERSVLRLSGERADKKQAHWQSVAVSACEQCGGNRVPLIHPVQTLARWLDQPAPSATGVRHVLSLAQGSQPLQARLQTLAVGDGEGCFLLGPEGGLGPDEERLALQRGFVPTGLGPRVLRTETAALAVLASALLLPIA
ncbi:16S rRNA (uracil(1498)-N(3))-methyltransferase [Curvibacter sp. APW13]|uniref:16S rRNA (uracil(1498)-N(3))-methyltransferase n=1 Tax=Curvibacter sp. APW13 TaxID=3077236 RepID=UPI0028DF5EC5|nr:16S rRNA (uracil(1498)-N(3))-methyltransferase [Curvibacter sp. APW13]MDT8990499.1 16S rRNA (uracil(1498)-N(3))-methyltransferase [Curvibacter sp. APW13]